MIRKADGWNIVLAGLWNRAIFTPEWVNELLFHEPEVETLLSVMPYLPIIYRNRQVAVEVSSGRLVFRPRRLNEDSLRQAESMASTVLNRLRGTPLLGVGLNFAFVEENPPQELVRLFNFGDNQQVMDAGWDLQERKIVRKMVFGTDTLNLSLIFDGRAITIEFNYHTDSTSNDTAREAVNDRVIRLRDLSTQLLAQAYHLDLAPEGNGNG